VPRLSPGFSPLSIILFGSVVLLLRCPAHGQAAGQHPLPGASSATCEPSWLTTIGEPGADSFVHALAVFDDGTGRALYVAGDFTAVEGVAANRIAKWDGLNWSALGSGLNSSVYALTVFDDGSGLALYAGGVFLTAGGLPANRIAKWDGSTWAALGSGVDGTTSVQTVTALGTFDDGSGLALYVGGSFTLAGGVNANRIAKWDGVHWTALGSGLDDTPQALAVFDDGSGPALYAAGTFTTAGGIPAKHIAKWDGSGWSALGGGLSITAYALVGHDDGSGPALYAGTLSSLTGSTLERWDGSSWSDVGTPNGSVSALTEYDDGSGLALFAGGNFTKVGGVEAKKVAKWEGSTWSPLGTGLNDLISAFAAFDDGNGTALYAGGEFTKAGGVDSFYLAAWGCPPEPSPWTNLGYALAGTAGVPVLTGTGELTGATPGTLTLEHAKPSSPSLLTVSYYFAPTPFKCGTLVPQPVLWDNWYFTSPAGTVSLDLAPLPPSFSGLAVYFQWIIPDIGAICHAALSNALQADVP